MDLIVDKVTRCVMKDTADTLFDLWDHMLWRGSMEWSCHMLEADCRDVSMHLMTDGIIEPLMEHGVDRMVVIKRLELLYTGPKHRLVMRWYHYLAGRIYMRGIPYCYDAPLLHFAPNISARHELARLPDFMRQWMFLMLREIGRKGDLWVSPPVF